MKRSQACATCQHQTKCWALKTNSGKTISPQNVVINILICRLQNGIDRDRAAGNLLKLYKPGIIHLISYAKRFSDINISNLLTDAQTTAITYLTFDYKIGDRGRATPYLFDPQRGFLSKWIRWVLNKDRRFYRHHELCAERADQDDDYENNIDCYSTQNTSNTWLSLAENGESLRFDPYTDMDDVSRITRQIFDDVIEDGITLNSNEYRVLKFCLANGNEQKNVRHVDGLHIKLGKILGVSRPRITRLYARAKQKISTKFKELKRTESDG